MPDDGSAPAVKAFSDTLWDGWIKAGPISYTEFEKLSKKVLGSAEYLPRSTVQAILKNRDRRSPPRWEWVLRFWRVLRALADEHHIDPESLGTLEGLKHLHEAALAEATLAGQRVGAPSLGTAVESLPNLGSGSSPEVPAVLWEQCAAAFPDADVRHHEMLASIRRMVGVEWWHDYRDVVPAWFEPYLSLEPAASLIHVYDNALVPSLLQTEAYARAALRMEPLALPEAAITRMIELRMRRQQIIRGDKRDNDVPRLWAVLDEGAVRRRFGDSNVMRGQLVHLIDICDHPNFIIQVIPASPGIRTTLSYPLTLLRFRIHEVPDVAYFEPITTGFYNHEAAHVSRYAQVLEALAAEALPPPETVAYLRQLHEEL